ncbi:MAG: LacI family DNA-binding transcriptional regulator [Candidatus Dormiibacterota bacterium]
MRATGALVEPTIRDVARQAGVSTATVSRVISGADPAKPQTRARVLAAIERLGYRPSAVARSLKLRTTRTLGLLVTDIQNPYYPEIVRAVEDAALERNLAVLLCNGADDPSREETYLDLLVDRRVDGIIIASSGLQERQAAWLARRRSVPVVLVNWEAPEMKLPAILGDNRQGGRLATEHLLSLGHRRIGHLSAPARNAAAGERLDGIRESLERGGQDPNSLIVVEGDGRVSGGGTAVQELLERMPDVTGIVCYNDLTAIGAVRALRSMARHVPDDISIVGYDDIALSAWVDPPLTTIAQPTAAMGRWAVRRLGELLGLTEAAGARGGLTDSLGPPPVIMPVELRERASTGKPRRSV